MDYYEELGLSRTASVAEIHQAYRLVARLIHPDQQPDYALRQLAETQMKRFNLILETLSDSVRRREYDLSLESRSLVPIPRQHVPTSRPRTLEQLCHVRRDVWVWMVAVLIGIAAIGVFSYSAATGSAGIRATSARRAAPDEPARPAPPHTSGPRAKAVAITSSGEPPLTHPHPGETPPRRALEQPPARIDSPVESTALLPAPEIALAIPGNELQIPAPSVKPFQTVAKPGFDGNWVYVPQAGPVEKKGLYSPEYIEVKIAEQDRQLRGSYSARYLVTDRAIPSSVTFHFEGRVETPLSTLRWDGSGGAYGRVTLKLISDNSLEVTWTASQLSNELGLIAGAATLVRRREP